MFDRSVIPKLVLYSVLSVFIVTYSGSVSAQQQDNGSGQPAYVISDLRSDIGNNSLSLEIIGNAIPAFTVSEEFSPFKVLLDIAGCELAEGLSTDIPANAFSKMAVSDLDGGEVKRFTFEIADTHDYKVSRSGNNIKIDVSPSGKQAMGTMPVTSMSDIQVEKLTDKTVIHLMANKPITDYKVGTLAGSSSQPPRMYIDIQDISVSDLIREKVIGKSVSRVRVAPRGTGARFVFDSTNSELFAYALKETPNSLQVVVSEMAKASSLSDNSKQVLPNVADKVDDSTLDELIDSSSNLMESPASSSVSVVEQLQDTFSFAGYNKERISVDFYKIDVHNVFRLFRQLTDQNIIVAEGVGGTLTLALSDVPWDFALDIIMNLLDLEKVERFNTIVIYPKKNAFIWPERAEDNLSFEADVEIVEQESLIIEESANQPIEIQKAKELIRQAQQLEATEDFEDAAAIYEQAGELWPDNSKITNRLATLYLVNLGMNAKALHFAKESLSRDNNDLNAALYAAIASANMQRVEDAAEYFTQAVSGTPPMKEALFSFAAFSENQNQEEVALKLLDKYNKYYGETLDTMLAQARLLDKANMTDKATTQYKAIISSGYQLRPDLKKYILSRISAETN